MYKNNFVVAVKNSKGRVLRDDGSQVMLPWHEEYSLLLKNKNSVRAVAKVFIDGEDVLNGKEVIIESHGDINLERYLNNNMIVGRKFQFVPITDSRISHKKNSGELGIIEVVFRKEKRKDSIVSVWGYINSKPKPQPIKKFRYSEPMCTLTTSTSASLMSCNLGGTAQGSRSTQQFCYSSIENLEDETTTIRLRIVPTHQTESHTVQDTRNVFCVNCGKKNPYKANFCMRCGNRIQK